MDERIPNNTNGFSESGVELQEGKVNYLRQVITIKGWKLFVVLLVVGLITLLVGYYVGYNNAYVEYANACAEKATESICINVL